MCTLTKKMNISKLDKTHNTGCYGNRVNADSYVKAFIILLHEAESDLLTSSSVAYCCFISFKTYVPVKVKTLSTDFFSMFLQLNVGASLCDILYVQSLTL